MSDVRRVAVASSVGNAIEFYDFLLYGTASALVFDKIFFPQFDSRVGVLLAFATFGAGFAARLLGGAVLGHFGDRVGRRTALLVTLVVTGVATALIGVLPPYESIGILAPLLLVLLRIVQGFFLGGEQSGAWLMTLEHAPPAWRGGYGGLVSSGIPVGLLLANLAMYLASQLPDAAFVEWGWRLPFLFSFVLVGVGLYVRLRVAESPEFARAAKVRHPAAEVLRTRWRRVLLGAGATIGAQVYFFLLTVFFVNYGRSVLQVAAGQVLLAIVTGALAQAAGLSAFGWLSDRVGRLPVMLGGALAQAALAFPLFWLMDAGWFTVAMVLGFVSSTAVFGPCAAYLSGLFVTGMRYSGVSLSFQSGAVLGGGCAPFAAAWLLELGLGTWPVSAYLLLGAVTSGACLLAIGQAHRAEPADGLPGTPPLASEA